MYYIPVILVLLLLVGFFIVKPYMTKIKSISTQESLNLVKNSNAVFIDVRKADAVKQQRIENSKHILIKDIEEKQIGDLIQYKDTPIIMVCYIGVSAKKAANLLHEQGFKQIYVLQGGMKTWNAENLPVIKD